MRRAASTSGKLFLMASRAGLWQKRATNYMRKPCRLLPETQNYDLPRFTYGFTSPLPHQEPDFQLPPPSHSCPKHVKILLSQFRHLRTSPPSFSPNSEFRALRRALSAGIYHEPLRKDWTFAITKSHLLQLRAQRTREVHHKPETSSVSLYGCSELKTVKAASDSKRKENEDVRQFRKQEEEVPGGQNLHAPLDLSDYEELYAKLASNELASTLLNLQLVSNDILVAVGTWVLNSRIMKAPFFSAPIYWLLERTAYHHFCAGGTLDDAARTLERMWQLGLQGILDYSIEDALTPAACDRNLEAFLRTIRMKSGLPAGSVSFACVKMTALCPLAILKRTSTLLRWHNTNPSPPPSWMAPSLPILAPDSPPLPSQDRPEPLTEAEAAELAASLDRLRSVAQACREESLPLLVDAEYTSVQPAIDYLTFAVALEFNGEPGQPLVYGTIQAYLKDAKSRLEVALRGAEAAGVSLGIKLVRGAYITHETEHARALGLPSPTHGSIEETHACYDACAAMVIQRAARGGDQAPAAVLATHNLESGRAAVVKIREEGLDPQSPLLQFAQLKGMADGLSLGLVREGFRVSKYLPFGPVADVIPYLVRRAEENKGLLGNTLADRRRLRKELWRRLTNWHA